MQQLSTLDHALITCAEKKLLSTSTIFSAGLIESTGHVNVSEIQISCWPIKALLGTIFT